MKRKVIILGIIVAMALVAVAVILWLPAHPTVSFSVADTQTTGSTPPMRRVSFYVTNIAGTSVFLQVAAIETNNGSAWTADTEALPAQTFRTLGRVMASETARLSVELPLESVPSRLRVLVSPKATSVQKAQFALRRLAANLRGEANHKQLWFNKMAVPAYEVITPEIP